MGIASLLLSPMSAAVGLAVKQAAATATSKLYAMSSSPSSAVAQSGISQIQQNTSGNDSFNAQQAAINRDWQERMSSTAYQRAVADMRAAGINPVLSALNGGAVTTSGSQASADTSGSSAIASLLSSFISAQTAIQSANINARTQEAVADKYTAMERIVADMNNATSRYNAALGSDATRYSADRHAAATMSAAAQSAAASMFMAEASASASRFAAQQSRFASEYATSTSYKNSREQRDYDKWKAKEYGTNAGLGSLVGQFNNKVTYNLPKFMLDLLGK
uniref:DNA pilot protein n=1 Tax=Dulem virus 109 TaxID=3145586 RepID=A0AAU8AY94_9VIRU